MNPNFSYLLAGFEDLVRAIYGQDVVPLHRPVFAGREKTYLSECIDTNFVSSIGAKVTEFEAQIAAYTGSKNAVATVNGTAALHVALTLAGVQRGDEVITQALSFIATCNALSYAGARPVFVDVDTDTLGLSPSALRRFLEENCVTTNGKCINKRTGSKIAGCVPMHTFGHACRIQEIVAICEAHNVPVIEDAAESLGTFSRSRHTGTFGAMGTFSFNGNKVITTGGGGMLITDDDDLARRAKHLTTTAKRPHPYEFFHDEVGYNYRMPNLNAALGCAQMERLPEMLALKMEVTYQYRSFFERYDYRFVEAPAGTSSNYWLNTVILNSREERDAFLQYTNQRGIMTRPVWRLMRHLPMYEHCEHDGLTNSIWLEDRLVNLPSSIPDNQIGRLYQ